MPRRHLSFRRALVILPAVALASVAVQSVAAAAGPEPVDLGAAVDFVILTKSGITNVPTSAIVGNLGTSPIASTAITGLSLVAHGTNRFSTSSQVTGRIYAADHAAPTPANLTGAIGDMATAYTDAAGRALPDFTELYAGDLSGRTLLPGLYKWGTGVSIATAVTLAGASDDVWIFQIAGNLTLSSGARVMLSTGARAANVFWQVGGGAGIEIGTTAHIEGTMLAAKAIHLRTGASLNGRAFSRTAVTLAVNDIVLVEEPLCGDYSGDRMLTAADALGALRAAVGLGSCSLTVCDFNGDGQLTTVDALAILQAAVGMADGAACPRAEAGVGAPGTSRDSTPPDLTGTTSTTLRDNAVARYSDE